MWSLEAVRSCSSSSSARNGEACLSRQSSGNNLRDNADCSNNAKSDLDEDLITIGDLSS